MTTEQTTYQSNEDRPLSERRVFQVCRIANVGRDAITVIEDGLTLAEANELALQKRGRKWEVRSTL